MSSKTENKSSGATRQHLSNVSADLIWDIVRNNNSYLVKQSSHGGAMFSRDPLNLRNVHTRKHAGFVNDQAVGVSINKDGGVVVHKKKDRYPYNPRMASATTTHPKHKSGPMIYKSIASQTAKSDYRSDLRAAAVARASAFRKTQKPVKPSPEPKLRGKKAKAAAAKKESS